MRQLLITLFLTLSSYGLLYAAESDDYKEIDEGIASYTKYVAMHEKKITEVREALVKENSAEGRFRCNFRLYELYKAFVSDSAIFYLRTCIHEADEQGWRSEAARCRSLLAIRCSNIGMYHEAMEILDSVRADGIDTLSLGTYYSAYNNLYSEMQYYTTLYDMKEHYLEKAIHYEELMMRYLPEDDESSFLRRELRAQGERDFKAALAVNDEWLKSVEVGSHPYALVALYRYIEYKNLGDTEQMMHWLKESVLSDIRNAAMDQGSMWELANELMLRGDIDRASRYISFTSDCANRYGSRQRKWQISPLLSHIAKEYKEKSEQTTHQLWVTIAVISILALLLFGVLLFLHYRNKQLSVARNALKESNDELASANRQLASQTDELSALNSQLSTLNSQLSESSRVKDEYIGRFLSLCSQYVDKIDNYRKMVNKKMKNKELDELFQMSKSTELKERELDELFENFDNVFLHLFPNFVDDFNALLLPEAQVHPKEENRLTTEIRIFALIRLGIEDSSKIAEFLHYSVNTIYNYRARTKNGAVGNRERFEQAVKNLGHIQ